MKRDLLVALVIWILLSALGILLALRVDLYPMAAAEEASVIDEAFQLLLVLSVPVAALVMTGLFYSLIRFRAGDQVEEDGPPVRSNQPLAIGWLVVTTALAVFVVFNPGLKGMRELEGNPNADLVVQVEGEQWHWNVTYPQHDLSYQRALQIAVPVDRRVKFEVTSKDVIHSFWIPGFRMKVDAVPGRTTEMYVTPSQVGDTEYDSNIRVQCAELCGTGHPRMSMDVHILEAEEFEHWISEAKTATGGETMEMDMDMDMDMSE